MIKAVLDKRSDKTPVAVFGLSHKNIDGLKNIGPITINMRELGYKGTIIINALSHANIVFKHDKDVIAINFTDDMLDHMAKGQTIQLKVDSDMDVFNGEILIFPIEHENSAREILNEYIGPETKIIGDTCAKCGSALREDGSCDCKESFQ